MLEDGTSVLDIGANIGAMSVYLAKHLKMSKIIAFEPIPVNVKVFKKVMDHYRLTNVRLIEMALGDRDGEVEMVLPKEHQVRMHGLCHVVHESIDEHNEGERYRIPMTTLDSLDELSTEQRISGIKIDVENFEFFVLAGGRKLLEKHKPIVYAELWANENRNMCFTLMEGLGYGIKVLSEDQLVIFDPKQHRNQNFFFVPAN
jgi:FkbM family methyltransferase